MIIASIMFEHTIPVFTEGCQNYEIIKYIFFNISFTFMFRVNLKDRLFTKGFIVMSIAGVTCWAATEKYFIFLSGSFFGIKDTKSTDESEINPIASLLTLRPFSLSSLEKLKTASA